MSSFTTATIIHEILLDYALPIRGFHGVVHWAGVLENGQRLAIETGANLAVVTLFALFHDSRRVNEHRDLGHGHRGARYARSLRGKLIHLTMPTSSFFLKLAGCTPTASPLAMSLFKLVGTPIDSTWDESASLRILINSAPMPCAD